VAVGQVEVEAFGAADHLPEGLHPRLLARCLRACVDRTREGFRAVGCEVASFSPCRVLVGPGAAARPQPGVRAGFSFYGSLSFAAGSNAPPTSLQQDDAANGLCHDVQRLCLDLSAQAAAPERCLEDSGRALPLLLVRPR